MLQQTRVETVIDYYRRFISVFPTAEALAAAPEADVLKLWEGLGYYSRARNLQKAARIIVEQHEGSFPQEYEAIRRLPGIGPYTAGAIASIAFGEPVLAIDGNVKRVASRLLGIRENIDLPSSQAQIAGALLRAQHTCAPGEFNQALMELGATICTPRSPRCDHCPIAYACDAYAENDPEQLPVRTPKAPPRIARLAVCIFTLNGRALLFKRQERLLHGLYVFGLYENADDAAYVRAQIRADGLDVVFSADLGEAEHVFTHLVWRMRLYHYTLNQKPDENWMREHQAQLADEAGIAALPLPTAMKAAKQAAVAILRGFQADHLGGSSN